MTPRFIGELYSSTVPNNLFSPVPGVKVEMSVIAGSAPGTSLHASTGGLSVEIKKHTRLLMIFYILSNGPTTTTIHTSAGLMIESAPSDQP